MIELLKQAIGAVEYADACLKKQLTTKTKHEYAQDLLIISGASLRQAIAELESQEPVAWKWRVKNYCDWPNWSVSLKRPADSGHAQYPRTEGYEDIPLYTTPPAQPPPEQQEPDEDWKDGLIAQQEETILWQATRIAELLDQQAAQPAPLSVTGSVTQITPTNLTGVIITNPPAQRTWVGLTDEDRYEFAAAQYSWEELLIAAEAKLKEKNT